MMGSFAADHVIGDPSAFDRAVALAVEVAARRLAGHRRHPADPAATAFGYVRQGAALAGHDGAFVVEEFVEKPSAEVARRYLDAGDYRWNAGMFVVRPRVLLDLLGRTATPASRRRCATSPRPPSGWRRSGRPCRGSPSTMPWPSRPRPAGRVATCRGSSPGTTSATSARCPTCSRAAPDGVRVLGDADLVRADAASRARGARRRPAGGLVGLDDVVVVDTAGRPAGHHPGPRPGGQGDRGPAPGDRPRRPDLTARPATSRRARGSR